LKSTPAIPLGTLRGVLIKSRQDAFEGYSIEVRPMNTPSHRHTYTINGREASVEDATPTPGQLLADAGYEPADDYMLVRRTEHGTQALSSDDSIDLRDGSTEFFAFEGGVAYQLTLNEHTVIWGEPRIEIGQLRHVGNVSDDLDLVWEREEGSNEVLARNGLFQLRGQGTEHLRTQTRGEGHEYIYFVDGVEYRTRHESLTGAQITAVIPNWDPVNSLVLEGDGDDQDEPIKPDTVVVFKGREHPAHFTITPPATFGGV
jgi:multiubiquitin